MAKKKAKVQVKAKEALLFETLPKSLEKLRPLIDGYIEAKEQRQASGKIEVEYKQKMIPIILKAKLVPREDGHIAFTFADVEFDVEPTGYSLHTKKAKKAKPDKE